MKNKRHNNNNNNNNNNNKRIKKQIHNYPEYNHEEKEVAIMGNTYAKIKGNKDLLSVNLPIGANKIMRFAISEEIMFALGIPEMENPNTCWIYKNYKWIRRESLYILLDAF